MINDLKKLIGPRLKQLRLERDLSVVDICERTGLSRNWVYVLERGEHEPSLETVARFADVLGVDENDILTFPESTIRHEVIDLTRHVSLDVLHEMKRMMKDRLERKARARASTSGSRRRSA
jgi:transcriptional regulator with XRE-family HTH domain